MTMATQHYCLFDTAIGPCGIAWGERGVTRVQLPESDGARPNGGCAAARLAQRRTSRRRRSPR